MRAVALDYPLLLAIPTKNLRYRCEELQFMMGISSTAARLLILAHPSAALKAQCSALKMSLLTGFVQHLQQSSSSKVCIPGKVLEYIKGESVECSEDMGSNKGMYSAFVKEEPVVSDFISQVLDAKLSSFVLNCSLSSLSRVLSSCLVQSRT
jgi:hypothetical protein